LEVLVILVDKQFFMRVPETDSLVIL